MQLDKIINEAAPLVSLPAVCMRLNDMVNDPACSAEDIGRVINQDTALTARILRMANSPMYGFSTQIDTVKRAVTILGTKQVRDIAIASSAVKTFKGIPNTLVSMQSFWEHSIYCALCARTLAMDCMRSQRESVFVAGLLHDIGKLILYHQLPEISHKALEASGSGQGSVEIQDAERKLLGFNHAEVGAGLMKRWSLPANLQDCVAFHHNPELAKQNQVEVAIIHLANSIAKLIKNNTTELGRAPKIHPVVWKLTGLEEEIIPATIASAQAQISSTQALLMNDYLH